MENHRLPTFPDCKVCRGKEAVPLTEGVVYPDLTSACGPRVRTKPDGAVWCGFPYCYWKRIEAQG